MANWRMVRTLLRRWPIVVAGLVLTVAAAQGVARPDTVYFSRTELAFLAPASSAYPNALRTTSGALIVSAGVIARRVSGPGKVLKFASPDVTLVGQGIRDGWSLRSPDSGGQWASNFATQVLALEVVGPSISDVERQRSALIERVQKELSGLQVSWGVAAVNRISVIEVPERAVLYPVSGDRRRAVGVVGLLGLGATIYAALTGGSFMRSILSVFSGSGRRGAREEVNEAN